MKSYIYMYMPENSLMKMMVLGTSVLGILLIFCVPQMMPIYWFFICLLVNFFVHVFFSFYYHNFLLFSKFSRVSVKKEGSEMVSFLK